MTVRTDRGHDAALLLYYLLQLSVFSAAACAVRQSRGMVKMKRAPQV